MSEYWHKNLLLPQGVSSQLKAILVNEKTLDGDMLLVSDSTFKKVFSINREYLYRGDCTSPPEEHDYKDNYNYLSLDGQSGFSISPNGWVISVFSNNKRYNLLEKLSSYTSNSDKVVVITNSNWKESALIKKYIEIGFAPAALSIDSRLWMTNVYGVDFMTKFCEMYGYVLRHVFLVKGYVGDIKSFDLFKDAYKYVDSIIF